MLVVRTDLPMNPSKTDHIMSRYRPIAPKPTPKTEGSSDQTDSHSLSTPSVDKSSKSGDYCRGKRRNNPKRDSHHNNNHPKSSPRNSNNGNNNNNSNNNSNNSNVNVNMKKPRHRGASSGSGGKSGGGVEGNVEFQPPRFNLTPIFSEQVAPVFGPGGLQRFKESFDHGVSVSLSLSAKSSPPRDSHLVLARYEPPPPTPTLQCSKDGLSFSISAGAAAATQFPPPPTTTTQDMGFMERAAINSTSLFSPEHSNFRTARVPFYSSFSNSFGAADSEVCSSAEEVAAPVSKNIVTLSLLPDTPSYVNTRGSTSSTSTLSLLRSDIRWNSSETKPATASSSDLNTSLTMSSWSELEDTHSLAGSAARFLQDGGAMGVVDAHDLEQRHGGSSEAVILTDERDTVLWVNSAFQRLSNERMSSRMQAIGPHIDPLGIRTQLATLTFQPPFPAARCKAVLWGFLKKFIMHEAGNHIQSEAQAKVIAPQPLRAVGSTITVQSIDTLNPNAAPFPGSYDMVLESLNKGDMPSVITDLRFRVRWVNTAYKRLVGQPKCSWLASAVGEDEAPLRLAGDVSLICEGLQLPDGIPAFTCHVGIQWSHQGEHSAMSVPSEVARLLNNDSYMWRFDVCDAGVKNVLQIENASPFC